MKKRITISIVSVLTLVAMLLTAFMLTGCTARGTGALETRSFNELTNFNSVRVSGSFIVELTQGDDFSVDVVMQGNLFNSLDLRVSDNTLYVGTRRGHSITTTTSNTPRVLVTAPDFVSVRTSGSSRIIADYLLTTQSLSINTSGSSRIELEVEADSVSVTTSGSSRVDLSLYTDSFYLNSSGSSNFYLLGQTINAEFSTTGSTTINAFYFYTANMDITSSGSARVDINVQNSLTVRASGSARINYRGNPTARDIRLSGSARVSGV